MEVSTISMEREEAYRYWKEYRDACKKHPGNGHLADMKACYNQLKSGRKLIDIRKVILAAGLKEDIRQPNFAICRANATTCRCKRYRNGDVIYRADDFWNERSHKQVILYALFEPVPWVEDFDSIILTAPVPAVPPSVLPAGDLVNYHILWEVNEWKMSTPDDPYLLRRITDTIFVVLGAWDLTELEKSVMEGRMYR